MFDANTLVYIPPVPTSLSLEVFAILQISFLFSVTISINFASLFWNGSSVYRPSVSVNSINKSDFVIAVTIADNLSFSPNSISSVAIASFSFTIGILPYFKSSSKVFFKFLYDFSLSKLYFVINTCDAVKSYSANSL